MQSLETPRPAVTTLAERKSLEATRRRRAAMEVARELEAYAREQGGRFVLFGSYVTDAMRHDSDLDVLIDFPADRSTDAWLFAEDRGRRHSLPVDLHDARTTKPSFVERVLKARRSAAVTDARWIEVADDVDSACRHFGNAVRLADEGGFEAGDLSGYRARMALLHAMQSAHTSLEGALRRILDILSEEPPTGVNAHADLVRRVAKVVETPGHARPAILSADIARDVDESRRFRHRATHDYDNFDPTLATPSIDAARRLTERLKPCIEAFRAAVDPA